MGIVAPKSISTKSIIMGNYMIERESTLFVARAEPLRICGAIIHVALVHFNMSS